MDCKYHDNFPTSTIKNLIIQMELFTKNLFLFSSIERNILLLVIISSSVKNSSN